MLIRYSLTAAAAALGAVPAFAAGLAVTVTVPRLSVSEYHRPYVAVFVERADNSTLASTLALWYDVRNKPNDKGEEGTKWLKDLRQWWRRGGRELSVPIDGVTGATKPAGQYPLAFEEGTTGLPQLPPGNYRLVVEAAREVGGHEVVLLPFRWPLAAGQPIVASGKEELGQITLGPKP